MNLKLILGLLILAIAVFAIYFIPPSARCGEVINVNNDFKYTFMGANPWGSIDKHRLSLNICSAKSFPSGGYSLIGKIDRKNNEINVTISGICTPSGGATHAISQACLRANFADWNESGDYIVNINFGDKSDKFKMTVNNKNNCLFTTTFEPLSTTSGTFVADNVNFCGGYMFCRTPTTQNDCESLKQFLASKDVGNVVVLYDTKKFEFKLESECSLSELEGIFKQFLCLNKEKNINLEFNSILGGVGEFRSENGNIYLGPTHVKC